MDHCVWYLLDWRVVFRYDTTTKTILVPSLRIVPKLLTGSGTTVWYNAVLLYDEKGTYVTSSSVRESTYHMVVNDVTSRHNK